MRIYLFNIPKKIKNHLLKKALRIVLIIILDDFFDSLPIQEKIKAIEKKAPE